MKFTIGLDDLEHRLGAKVPVAYRAALQSEGAEVMARRGFDPKTLLVLNLNLRDGDRDGHTGGRFLLNSDGCGNYYFVEFEPAAKAVLLWSHDPPGIEDQKQDLGPYLRTAQQECRIDRPLHAERLCICRSTVHAESILDPIALDEWIAAVDGADGIENVSVREGKNPFTGEVIRVETPGAARVLGVKRGHVALHCRRVEMDDSPLHRPIATALAEKLRARVILGSAN